MEAIEYQYRMFHPMSNAEVWNYAKGALKKVGGYRDPVPVQFDLLVHDLRLITAVLMDRLAGADPKVADYVEHVEKLAREKALRD